MMKPPESRQLVLLSVLTPHKVSLLALIAAYCSGILPQNSLFLSLLVKLIEQHPTLDNDPVPVDMPINDFIALIEKAILSEPGSAPPDASLVWSRLILALWSLHDLDEFHLFMFKLKSLLVSSPSEGAEILAQLPSDLLPKKLLTKHSFLGRFVVQCYKDFTSLEFEETQRFWAGFVKYRAPSVSYYLKVKNTMPVEGIFGSNDNSDLIQAIRQKVPHLFPVGVTLVSRFDLTKALAKQIRLMEAYGTPTPADLKNTLKLMAEQGSETLPASYYLNYLVCLNESDYEGAFKNLHAYFDYMMSSVSQGYYQYALLSLATLHTKFNAHQQALEAIKEAIIVARENSDNGCLKYLFFWLFDFLKNRPELNHSFFESNEQLLGFLTRKEPFDGLPADKEFSSNALQMEATQSLIDGASLRRILENMLQAEYLALNSDFSKSSFVVNCFLRSLIWSRVGEGNLAELYVQVAQSSASSLKDLCGVCLRLAWLCYEKTGDLHQAIEILHDKQYRTGDNDPRFITETYIMSTILELKHLLHTGKLYDASVLLSRLKADQTVKSDNLDLRNEVLLLGLRLEMLQGNTDVALKSVTKELKKYESSPTLYNSYWYIKLSVFYCELICGSGDHSAVRALPMVHKLLKLTVETGMASLNSELILLLARVLLILERPMEAYGLLGESLGQFVHYGGVFLQARVRYVFAESVYELLKKGYFEHEKREDVDTVFYGSIKAAKAGFEKLQNKTNLEMCAMIESAYKSC